MNDHPCCGGVDRYSVLLVDDDPWMLRIMKAALSPSAQVTTCTSGEQALDLLETEDFDVVCSDLLMPGMSGAELLAAVARAHGEISRLLVTGAADEVRPEDRAGCQVLIKPFDPEHFAGVVEDLARSARRPPLRAPEPFLLAMNGGHR